MIARLLLLPLLLFVVLGWQSAHAQLTIKPTTWNIIGLDSNDVTVGPDTFQVGTRVCNSGATTVNNVRSEFFWESGSTNPYINLNGSSLIMWRMLAPGACVDFYYPVTVTRNSLAINTKRGYYITARGDGTSTVTTPRPRELYVERLLSQNRNNVDSIIGPSTVYIGQTYNYTINARTATSYPQLESFLNLSNVTYQVLSVSATYGTPGATNDQFYADACGWQTDPTLPNYRTCTGPEKFVGGKVGGNVSTTYTVKILGVTGSATAGSLILDFSGGSYHYSSGPTLTITALPSEVTFLAKIANPTQTLAGTNVNYTLRLTNTGSSAYTLTDFVDTPPTSPGTPAYIANSSTFGGTPVADPVQAGGKLTWSGSFVIPGGQTRDLTYTMTMPGVVGSYVNSAVAFLDYTQIDTTPAPSDNAPATATVTVYTPRTVSGTVYEDVNGDSSLSDGVTRPGVAVRLYQDANNNGLVDAGDTFLAATTTDASGQYSFQVAYLSTGNNYLVAVDSKGVTPSATLIAGRGEAWAEQTYGDNPATAALDLGSRFGGRQSGVSDNFNAATTAVASNTYEHLARVDVSAANVSNVNFGFSFNVVTNTRGGDAADDDAANTSRTVQGSLRQFIQNANSVNGANYMRFVPAVAANAGTYWQVSVTSALAAINDPNTTVDGTAYSNSNGTTQLDTNAGALGVGGTVGVDSVSLSQVGRPELEVVGSAAIAVGLDLQASNSTVRRVAIRGFGATANNDTSANIRIGNNFTSALIEQNFLGLVASAATFTTSAATSTGDNVRSAGADSGTIRNNLIGFSSGKGIQLGGTSTGWLVENNEVRYNGIGNANLDGIDIENGSGNCTVRGNLLVANEGAGVDMYMSSGGNTIENNTITGNGIGAGANIESPGVRVYGASSTFSRNVINANFGAGILVTSNASGNVLTRNSIFANGTITNKGGAAASNQIGIDLLTAANSQTTGTSPYVTVNDNGDADSGGNGLSNFPVITSARVLSGNLVLQGYARPGASLELFIAAPDPSGFGEGQTYLLTLVEGSAADEQATTGTYTSPVGGLTVGTDTTNLFKFTIPLPAGVAVGMTLTATATGGEGTSEFSGNIVIAAAPPEVKLEKRCTAPANCEDDAQQPGTELTYTITFTNTAGTSPAQGLTIIDIIPITDTTTSIVRNTEFKVGSMTFNPGTSTLSIVPTDYKYYNDPLLAYPLLPPWTPSAAYTPSGAYDFNVTYVGWKLTGTMPPGTSGSVSFTVRIR